ncbi:MAG: PfkB family carbohydrate kinase [Lentisphaeria bacterium]
MKRQTDITFMGHMCYDEIHPFEGEVTTAPGSAVLCGAMAAARVGCEVTVVTRMNSEDEHILDPMRALGIECVLVPVAQTTRMRVVHPCADVDVREMDQVENAGFMQLEDMPAVTSRFVHLAGITDREFTVDLIRGLRDRGYSVSADMQSFVRQVDPQTRKITFADVPEKAEIVSLLDRVKLDVVEAALLTGTDDLEIAARQFADWGCPEVVITRSDGVLARVNGKTFFEPFSNRSTVGRTGRGDTTFAGYMAWRLNHTPAEALKFAAALVSLKMESLGPFAGTLDDVLQRLQKAHR